MAGERRSNPFVVPNPVVVAAIARSSEHRRIVAARDIVDLDGVKLWARDNAVTVALQERLLERKLREPLESSLLAADGVTPEGLLEAARDFIGSANPLAPCIRPYFAAIEPGIGRLRLHPAVQLLLTAAKDSNPPAFEHAVAGMVLAGAMSVVVGGADAALDAALLGGLLHDIGEMYVRAEHLDPARQLDPHAFRFVAVHPRIGSLVLSELTDYPLELARAVDEHHERLDGSGYPVRKQGAAISDLGRLLAVVDAVLGILGGSPRFSLGRVVMALAFIPSEFDQRWTSLFRRALETGGDGPDEAVDPAVRDALREAARRLDAATVQADARTTDATSAPVKEIARYVARRLALLRKAWVESGLWALIDADDTTDPGPDAQRVAEEMAFRLNALRRDVAMRASELPADARPALDGIVEALAP